MPLNRCPGEVYTLTGPIRRYDACQFAEDQILDLQFACILSAEPRNPAIRFNVELTHPYSTTASVA